MTTRRTIARPGSTPIRSLAAALAALAIAVGVVVALAAPATATPATRTAASGPEALMLDLARVSLELRKRG